MKGTPLTCYSFLAGPKLYASFKPVGFVVFVSKRAQGGAFLLNGGTSLGRLDSENES